LESRCFEKAQTLRTLLLYLWNHRDQALNEYAIATEALGRNNLFDPKIDATVRVQISRLRQRLERFYEEEGREATERLVIPLGAHQLQVETITVPAIVSPLGLPVSSIAAARSHFDPILATTAATLFVICCVLGVFLYRAKQNQVTAPMPPEFWKTFFGNSRPSRILFPTPVFFSWTESKRGPNSTVMFRDTEINDFASADHSASVRNLSRQLGAPSLAQSYTVTSDTFAAVRLTRYLDLQGFSPTVMSSASAPLEALDQDNVIALGTWGTLRPLQLYLSKMNFELGEHEVFVTNRNPGRGEPRRFDVIHESPERAVWPGVIAFLPGRNGKTHLLILASRHTAALVAFLTSTNGLDQFTHLWQTKGSPRYFELVIAAEMNADQLVRFWPLALHSFPPK
jgi:hypothetical protein